MLLSFLEFVSAWTVCLSLDVIQEGVSVCSFLSESVCHPGGSVCLCVGIISADLSVCSFLSESVSSPVFVSRG